ncbi:Sterol 3-beta-glucosyltransferase [Lachnellula hyalina]|uniref:Sterol 3-beta-glucosyltransferase n=1 Tax=Lachnellula hyalina TaxID=1316788 RepID=A0A8H8QXN1_9HELO|nr:Sterol 3-beta-glucosyltransferase [Lachnellula hyalina]TVY24035.1 Sterol 3-beta-glucosyltransferase [Lachnellula hyalina]
MAIEQEGLGVQAHFTGDGRIAIDLDRQSTIFSPSLKKQLHEQTKDVVTEDSKPTYEGHSEDRSILTTQASASQQPPSRLNIVMHAVGSRGDVQPFVALGLVLKSTYNHRVRIATHPIFKSFVEETGLEFFSIGGDPHELMAFMVRSPGLLPSLDALRGGDVARQRKMVASMMEGCWRACIEDGDGMCDLMGEKRIVKGTPFVADVIVANPPSFAHVHCGQKLGVPVHLMFTMPWSATQAFPHPLANIRPSTEDFGLPRDWASHISVAGFYFLNRTTEYAPDRALAEFLQAGTVPIYVGFGSIVIDNPEALTKTIFDAIELAGVRAVVSKGWGGLGSRQLPSNVFLIGDIPHDWLFRRISAVVHHGGAGTTAAAISAGKPSVIVPFFGDQFFWGATVHRAGVGAKSIPGKDLTVSSLAMAIIEVVQPAVLDRADILGRCMEAENGTDAGCLRLHQQTETQCLKCWIAPRRVAVWKVRKNGICLSAFAATVLLNARILRVQDLKL